MICNARADCGSPYKSRLSHASFTPVARPRTTPHTTPPQARDCLDERGEGALTGSAHRNFFPQKTLFSGADAKKSGLGPRQGPPPARCQKVGGSGLDARCVGWVGAVSAVHGGDVADVLSCTWLRPVGACTAREERSAGSRCGEAPCVLRAPGMLLDWARVGAEQITGCHGACVERSGCFCMGVACCTLPWMVQMWRRIGHLQHCSRASASCTTEPCRRDGWLRLGGEW